MSLDARISSPPAQGAQKNRKLDCAPRVGKVIGKGQNIFGQYTHSTPHDIHISVLREGLIRPEVRHSDDLAHGEKHECEKESVQ